MKSRKPGNCVSSRLVMLAGVAASMSLGGCVNDLGPDASLEEWDVVKAGSDLTAGAQAAAEQREQAAAEERQRSLARQRFLDSLEQERGDGGGGSGSGGGGGHSH